MFAAHLGFGGGNTTGEISLTDTDVASSAGTPDFANARYQIDNDGFVKTSDVDGGALSNFEQWCTGDPADYEIRATLTLGTINFGTFDTWLAGSSDNLWRNRTGAEGFISGTMLIEIRDVATQTIQDSATITLEATVV